PSIHITIPATRRATAIGGVIVHCSLNAEQAIHPVRLPPWTRLEETVLDLTDQCHDVVDAMDWLTRALGRRLTTQDQLMAATSRTPQAGRGPAIMAALSPDLAGIHSPLEYRYYHDVERPHALPKSKRQSRTTLGRTRSYRDVLYDEYGLIVELDGQVAHPADERWRDIRRDNASAAGGVITLRYGYPDLTANPCPVAAQVAEVLRLRGWQGKPQRCSPDCPIQ